MPIREMTPLVHTCGGCGGSCQGVRVRLLDDEVARVQSHAAALGLSDVVEEGRLRLVDGRCVLLEDTRCRLHSAFGAAAKPAICRQYPLVLLDTGAELRGGLDPGCYSARPPGSPIDWTGAVANRVVLEETAAGQEAAILVLLQRAPSVAAALAALGVAPGFDERFRAAARTAGLGALLARPEAGGGLRSALAGVIDAVECGASPGALAPEEETHALASVGALVGLRLCASFPFVPGVALLGLGGARLCAAADPRPEPFRRALAGWMRAVRAPAWWSALVPGPDAMRALYEGAVRPPGGSAVPR
jgi:Fe-S-cluster containining protein